jgi:hypothetical protein
VTPLLLNACCMFEELPAVRMSQGAALHAAVLVQSRATLGMQQWSCSGALISVLHASLSRMPAPTFLSSVGIPLDNSEAPHQQAPAVQIAQQVGADVGILSDAGESPLAVGDRIKAALGPRGPAVVFDCVGFEATMQV